MYTKCMLENADLGDKISDFNLTHVLERLQPPGASRVPGPPLLTSSLQPAARARGAGQAPTPPPGLKQEGAEPSEQKKEYSGVEGPQPPADRNIVRARASTVRRLSDWHFLSQCLNPS